MRHWLSTASKWAALAALLAAAYHTAGALVAARSLTATSPVSDGPPVHLRPLTPRRDPVAITSAVEADPFREDRMPATVRYRLPGAVSDTELVMAETAAPAVTLVGTVMSMDGSGFALLQSGDEPPKVVRPGETFGGLTLRRVEQARATFTDADGRLDTLSVPKAGPP